MTLTHVFCARRRAAGFASHMFTHALTVCTQLNDTDRLNSRFSICACHLQLICCLNQAWYSDKNEKEKRETKKKEKKRKRERRKPRKKKKTIKNRNETQKGTRKTKRNEKFTKRKRGNEKKQLNLKVKKQEVTKTKSSPRVLHHSGGTYLERGEPKQKRGSEEG